MYYVIAQDGQRYGPVDLATLNQWTLDNRVVPTTTLEGQDGQRLQASAVPGIVFPAGGAPTGPAGPAGSSPYGAPTGAPGGYGAPGVGASGYAPYPHAGGMAFGDNGQSDVTKAWIFGALGFFCCPVIFSTMGIIYGNNAAKKGHPQGKTAMIFSIVTLILGIIVGVSLNIFSRSMR
ncbi:hypothetical protein EON81_28690 [bacterium]|nr:MAG: hypothetical protein EON81_28690 [bacterium]